MPALSTAGSGVGAGGAAGAETAAGAVRPLCRCSIPLKDNEALRYLDAIDQVLRAVKAPQAEIAEATRLYDELIANAKYVATASA